MDFQIIKAHAIQETIINNHKTVAPDTLTMRPHTFPIPWTFTRFLPILALIKNVSMRQSQKIAIFANQ